MTDCVCTILFSVSRENSYQEEVYWREDDDSDPSVSSSPNESIKWFTSLCSDKEKITTRIYSLVLHRVLIDRCILHPCRCLQACQRAEDSTPRLPWHHLRSLRYGGYCKDASCNVRTTLCRCDWIWQEFSKLAWHVAASHRAVARVYCHPSHQ